jgi:anti-anti-sigma regulatory factor
VTLDQSAKGSVVRFEGEVGVGAASEVKDALLDGLASGRELAVDLARVNELDVTTLQLLWAAERAAAEAGVKLGLTSPMPEEMGLAMDLAGLERFAVDPR